MQEQNSQNNEANKELKISPTMLFISITAINITVFVIAFHFMEILFLHPIAFSILIIISMFPAALVTVINSSMVKVKRMVKIIIIAIFLFFYPFLIISLFNSVIGAVAPGAQY